MTDLTQRSKIRTARRITDVMVGISLLNRRVWYAEEGTAPEPSTPTPEQPTSEAKFTQADVDRLLGERAKRAEEAATKKLLEQFGVDNPETLKESLKKAKEREEAELSEAQRYQKQLEAVQKANAALTEQMNAIVQTQRAERRNNAIIAAAQEAKAIDASDVVAWAAGQSELIDGAMKEDGSIDTAAVKKIVDAAKKAKPHFFTSGGVGSPSNADGRVPKVDPKAIIGKRPFGSL